MAEKPVQGGRESSASFARRVDPASERLSPEQREFMRQAETAQWQRGVARRLRGRNVLTGLTIGAVVLGIYSYTFYSVSQEKFLDELEEEAKVARTVARKTSAN
ncbi:cytochrome c oxidase assembly factor 3 homolog, mitochondrial [Rhinatrema bivittatum]|uniref:cytochrome c oxidase assembly factor 3 homolog, mitochondrial n=1 Tax=Rhinatrema bivittatum TaxID=194408 RepID=UPI001129EB33|nr:cytochrome c oxidase assembly factor 3 homolog, mitochondrial [Rhinatrema bivittatum]